ncbi:hypothetical protein U1Q18_011875, partial [Sarracenia purpurea var. burkii]
VEETTSSLRLVTDALDWPESTMSLYDGKFGDEVEEQEFGDGELDNPGGVVGRRSLFWRTILRYYISYGALIANRIPCPPRSGRSYYTPNCYLARGPIHPYTRGCSRITRCRR